MARRDVEIAKWLLTSGIDLKVAARITDMPARRLAILRDRLDRHAARVFLPPELDIAIAARAADRKLSFVQVGANDGKQGDPIHSHVLAHGAQALLIEPQPWLIEDLRNNYAAFTGDLMVENIAIGPENGTLALHILKREFWDDYITRVGRSPTPIFSPDREQVLQRIAPRLGLDRDEAESCLDMIEVPMQPLSEVIARHGLDDPDVLQIDCEGWDVQVILSLGECRPAIINFESFNLSDRDWKTFLHWSKQNGYGFIRGLQDTLAVLGMSPRVEL